MKSSFKEWFFVRFDDDAVDLKVHPPGGAAWERRIEWERIVRVCFRASASFESDEIYLFTDAQREGFFVPIKADGGVALWDEILRRKLFDASVTAEAAADRGELFCSQFRTTEAEREEILLYSPRQLPELEGDALTLVWDQIEAESIISHQDQIVWRERTGWEVYERFEEIAVILRHKYGKRLIDIVPTQRSLYALYGDSTRATFHVAAARRSLAAETTTKKFYWHQLEKAAREGDAATIAAYLAEGGDPNTRSVVTASTDTLLHVAGWRRQTAIARMLIAARANVNATDFFDKPPLVAALDTIRMSAAHPPAGKFKADPATLLLERTTELVKMLVYAGANLNGLSRPFNQMNRLNQEMYRSPLTLAAGHGYTDALRFLLAEGAKIEIEDYLGETPLIDAIRVGQTESAHILIDAGADVRRMPYSPNQAAETQVMMVVRSERFEPEEKLELIRRMTEAGADINQPDATGDTPLIKAIRFGTDHYYAMIGYSKPGRPDNVEWQATRWPVQKKTPPGELAALVRVLRAAGADAGARDRDGRTARELATEAGLTEAAAVL